MNQPARDANKAAIVEYFSRGFKHRERSIGIELEHTLVREDGSAVSYSEKHGVQWVLEALASRWEREDRTADGDLLGLSRANENVTLEPAAQLELSAGPFTSLQDAAATFYAFEAELFDVCEPAGIRIETRGYHPTARAATLELIPKARYEIMNRYLGAIGPFGIDMMRGSASTQVSIDYRDERDAIAKLRLAFALSPILACITDNAPVFEGEARSHPCVRTEIWRHCDPDRCGLVTGVMDEGFSFERYADYVLDTPAVITTGADGAFELTHKTFGELFATHPMDEADVVQALSMFFTDARLKTYLEIRPADAMPIDYVLAYAALIKGVFYCDRSIRATNDLLGPIDAPAIIAAQDAIMKDGINARVYDVPISELAADIIDTSRTCLSADDQKLLEPLAELVARRMTLADLVFP